MGIYLITGTSGAGKTYLCNILKGMGVWEECISHTTRMPRIGEKYGVTYYYVDKDEFNRMYDNEEFAEKVVYSGNTYGISKAEISRVLENNENVFVIVDYNGYTQMKEIYPEAVGIFLYETEKQCFKNMIERGDSVESAIERMKNYKNEIKNRNDYDYVIKNAYGRENDTVNIINNIIIQNNPIPDVIRDVYNM